VIHHLLLLQGQSRYKGGSIIQRWNTRWLFICYLFFLWIFHTEQISERACSKKVSNGFWPKHDSIPMFPKQWVLWKNIFLNLQQTRIATHHQILEVPIHHLINLLLLRDRNNLLWRLLSLLISLFHHRLLFLLKCNLCRILLHHNLSLLLHPCILLKRLIFSNLFLNHPSFRNHELLKLNQVHSRNQFRSILTQCPISMMYQFNLPWHILLHLYRTCHSSHRLTNSSLHKHRCQILLSMLSNLLRRQYHKTFL